MAGAENGALRGWPRSLVSGKSQTQTPAALIEPQKDGQHPVGWELTARHL